MRQINSGRRWRPRLDVLVVGLALVCGAFSQAQAQRRNYYSYEGYDYEEISGDELLDAEFFFVRLKYSCGRSCRGGWTTDYPDAEIHVLPGISRLTRVATGERGRIVSLNDDLVMDYPWLYAVEVGQWYLNDQEAAILREYLDRGGFLMVDDFWGSYEWAAFAESMLRVFPDRPIIDLAENHPLLHVLYDLDQRTQIPGRGGQRGETPRWRGIFDDDDRLMVAINFNMDMGDAWEHADDPWYPEPMTALAYRFAVNYLIYAMTH